MSLEILTDQEIRRYIINVLLEIQDEILLNDIPDSDFMRVQQLILHCNINTSPTLFVKELMEFIMDTELTEEEEPSYSQPTNMNEFIHDVAWYMYDDGITTFKEWVYAIYGNHIDSIAELLTDLVSYLFFHSNIDVDSNSNIETNSDSNSESNSDEEEPERTNPSEIDSSEEQSSQQDVQILLIELLPSYLDLYVPPLYQDINNDILLDAGLPLYSEFSLTNFLRLMSGVGDN
jgi:hypothetical protein